MVSKISIKFCIINFPSLYVSVRLNVVFGQVAEGMEVVKKIESYGSQSGKTSKKVVIANSGQC